jgi:hypothetical protein
MLSKIEVFELDGHDYLLRSRRRSSRGGWSGWGSRGRRRRAVRVCGPGVVDAARVVMKAALWQEVAAEVGGLSRDDTLRQLEACAHVPARLVGWRRL